MPQRLVKDINIDGSSSPNELIEIEGILYFIAEAGASEAIGLWKSDGSEGGTRLLRSFDGVSNLVEAGGVLYFVGQTGGNYALWSSDGTSVGTKKINTFYPGANQFAPYNLFSVDDTLFFSTSGAEGSNNGYELWRWEGNDTGTKLFKNLFPDRYVTKQSIEVEVDEETSIQKETLTIETEEFGTNNPEYSPDSFPGNFTSVGNGNIFFSAYSTTTIDPIAPGFPEEIRLGGLELWFSDGTENGTRPIQINKQKYKIYNPTDGTYTPPELYDRTIAYEANGSSFPKNLTALGTDLYFSANDGKSSGFELWTINNKGEDLAKISDLQVNKGLKLKNPESLTAVGDKLYFTTSKGKGRKLWALNKDSQKVINLSNRGKNPRHLAEIGSTLYYSANSGKGREPWFINSKNRPQLVQDINRGINSSNPRQFKLIHEKTNKGESKNVLYFTANGGEKGIELWRKDLSKKSSKAENYADIYNGQPSSDPRNLISLNNRLFFTANDGDRGRELWTIDANYPTSESKECDPSDSEECSTNQANTSKSRLVKNIGKGAKSSDPTELYNHRNTLIFSANNNRNGFEPWVTQASTSSAKMFKDINKGKQSSSPSSFKSHKNSLFFAADNGHKGSELWVSSGSKNGTKLAADIRYGQEGSFPTDLLTLGKMLYLSADDGIHGRELWSYNIKSGQYQLVRDIRTDSYMGSNPSELTPVNGQIIFTADGNVYGRELWRSDGTKNGTKLLLDINPGGLDSNPKYLSLLDGNLYFTASTYFNGRQILKLDGSGLNVTEIIGSSGQAIATEPSDLYASWDQLFFSAETTLEPPEENKETTSSSEERTNSDPGGFMAAANGIDAESVEYINNYNNQIDSYRKSNDNEYLEFAKSWAELLMSSSLIDTKDSSLALDWNQYFQPESGSSPIQIPSDLTSTAASRTKTAFPDGDNLTQPADEMTNSLGRELWISNGKVNGNTLLKDIYPGEESSNPQGFTAVDTKTYFSADDGKFGEELWVTDGTESGTFMISDINAGQRGSSPRSITEVEGVVYFSAKTDRHGRELWKLEKTLSSKAQTATKDSSRNRDLELTRLVYDTPGKGHLRGKRNTTDEFIFSKSNQFGPQKADRITSFSIQDGDTIQLNTQAFPGLKQKRFKVVSSLQSFNRQLQEPNSIIYFEPLGELYFNQNGGKPGLGDPKESGLFAVLKGAPELRPASIELN